MGTERRTCQTFNCGRIATAYLKNKKRWACSECAGKRRSGIALFKGRRS